MPRKVKIEREYVVSAALRLVQREGEAALNARAVAKEAGVSTQPVFSHFSGMEALKVAVIFAAQQKYDAYLTEDMARGTYLPYKASGMAYIRFAREEKNLFRLLFMRNRTGEVVPAQMEGVDGVIAALRAGTGFSEADARAFHLEMWVFVHGIAAMTATSYLELPENAVSELLSDAYWGLKARFAEKIAAEGAK